MSGARSFWSVLQEAGLLLVTIAGLVSWLGWNHGLTASGALILMWKPSK